MIDQLQHGLELGLETTITAIGFLAGSAIVLAPIAIAAAGARMLWVGPLAKAGWRVRAWRLARRIRRSRPGS